VRPPVQYTEELKRQQIRTFGYHDRRLSHYEEDHLIPLGLGGALSDPRNLWPEPRISPDGWGADRKDEVEFALNQLVCSGRLPLREAQRAIATDWIAAMLDYLVDLILRTQAHGKNLLSPARLVFRGATGRGDAAELTPPLSRAVEGERWSGKAGVLRPPLGPSHPKAAISASAAWRPTVAGPATGGSYGFHLSPVMWV
jgi:hypothetical protein